MSPAGAGTDAGGAVVVRQLCRHCGADEADVTYEYETDGAGDENHDIWEGDLELAYLVNLPSPDNDRTVCPGAGTSLAPWGGPHEYREVIAEPPHEPGPVFECFALLLAPVAAIAFVVWILGGAAVGIAILMSMGS